MKTEQEIKKLAEKVCYSEAWGYEKGYTQAQTDMQAELEAKDSEIARLKIGIKVASGVLLDKRAETIQLKSELQEAETHLLNFVDWIEKEISIFDERPKKELYKEYIIFCEKQQSKTTVNEKGTTM